jgi:O-antigen/teichoic acid export membrane protein
MVHDYKRITKQIGVSYFFTILTFILSPLLVILLTRTLTVSEYGIFSIFSATISTLYSILLFGFPTFIITKFPSFDKSVRVKSIFSIVFSEVIFLMVILTILFVPFIKRNILFYLKLESYFVEFQLTLIITALSVIFLLFSSYVTANRKLEFSSFIDFCFNGLWIIFVFIFIFFFKYSNIITILSLWLIGIFVSLIILLIYLKEDIILFFTKLRKISLNPLKAALSFGILIIPITISSWIITVSDRYLLSYFHGKEAVGIYTLSYSLVLIILTFSTVVSNIIYPYLVKAWVENKNQQILFNAQLKYSLMIIIPAIVGLFILREQIITLFSGPKYLAGSSAISILIIFPLFASLINVALSNLLIRGKTKLIALIFLSGASMNIILNFLLIPRWAINGASLATVLSYLFMFLLFYLICKKQFLWDFKFLRIGQIVTASALMGLALIVINPQIYLTKIATIIMGGIIYFILLFLLRVFVNQEKLIILSFVPKVLQNIFKIKK